MPRVRRVVRRVVPLFGGVDRLRQLWLGCGACQTACPYDARHLAASEDGYFGSELNEYETVMYEAMPPMTVLRSWQPHRSSAPPAHSLLRRRHLPPFVAAPCGPPLCAFILIVRDIRH